MLADVLAVLLALAHAFGKQVFYLPVHRAEVIFCPRGYRRIELRRQPQRYLLLACHYQYRLPEFTTG